MDGRAEQFIGLDVGAHVTLLAGWSGVRDAAWPLRARIEALRATTDARPAGLRRLVSALCATLGRQPEACTLVRMGTTDAALADDLATQSGLRGVVAPARPCVLWSEGVLPTGSVLEFARPLDPAANATELPRLRMELAALMEAAAEAVQARVLDQDDTLLDRYVDARYAGRPEVVTVPVEALTDTARLLAPFYAAYPAQDDTARDDAPVEIVSARLRCIFLT